MTTPAKQPSASDPLDIMLSHHRWSNHELLVACRPLSTAQFHQLFPIGLGDKGGLHRNITHMISAAGRWADRIRTIEPMRAPLEPFMFAPPPDQPQADARDRTPDELIELNQRFCDDLEDAARFSRAAGLGSTFSTIIPATGGPKTYTYTRAAALTHVLMHSHYHRAQCLNMLRQLGVTVLPLTSVTEWQLAGEP
jgi:uncharacterized damage-inducible protein DinB